MAIVALAPLATKFLASLGARKAAKKILEEALKAYAKKKKTPPKDLSKKITNTIANIKSKRGKEIKPQTEIRVSTRDLKKNVVPKTKTQVGSIPLKTTKGKFSRKDIKIEKLTKGFKKDKRKKEPKTNAPGFTGTPPKAVGGGAKGLKKAAPKLSLLDKAKKNKGKIIAGTSALGIVGSGVTVFKGVKKNKKLATNGGSDNKHISSSTKPKGSNILDKKRNVMGKYGGINLERKIGPKKRK